MQPNPNDAIKLPISNVSVGMFVTAIEHSKKVNLANAGRISSEQAINQLVESGVKFVWVDSKLSAAGCTFQTEPDEPDLKEEIDDVSALLKPKGSRATRQKRAKKLIGEAKDLAHKILTETFDGRSVELNVVEDWADNMIDAILVDSDAIKIVSALRQKDTYLLEHSVNVACLLITFGRHLDFDKHTLRQLAIGGILHDVGKIKIRDEVLNKPGRLTPEEFEHIKLHQVYAKDIVPHIEGLSDISRDVCLMHHEKLDGNGYPNGLKGDELPTHGRMSSIVDIYDALTADRCYKDGMSSAAAFKIMLTLTPFHLDQDLVYKFINCIGMYPVGSLVELSDSQVGIVWTSNDEHPLKPEIKVFYSRKYKRFTDVKFIDLKHSSVKIVKAISPSGFEVDATPFFE
ncbi:HD-GYP domain-containing protein [Vibrio tapetis]|uniref:HD-GYP domain-containing protein n=1 Tax=Vibrio tapetis TaxID=52443 RepID=UPI000C837AED|nr:HD-GYP domain-containing protein [Vibrio tapetis]